MKFVHTADTHLGFEITKTVLPDPGGRLSRSEWILMNYKRVVQHAVDIEADLFMHSGDLFNKYYIPIDILYELIQPILDISDKGVKVLLIPGNHERSEFPFELFQGCRNIHVFDCPSSMTLTINGFTIGIAGFPFIRENSRILFMEALKETEYQDLRTDFNILMTHQAFDGAVVGPKDFIFSSRRSDTVQRGSVPVDFDYIAAGHIHRNQILRHPLKPELRFVYPGSTQRMSFAEMFEEKYFVEGELLNNRIETRFIQLPVYGMEIIEINAAGMSAEECEKTLIDQFWRFSEDLVIRFNLTGGSRRSDYPDTDFEKIRSISPPVLECQFAIKMRNGWVYK